MTTTVHLTPEADAPHHDTTTDDPACPCAPHVITVHRAGHIGWIIQHYPLDGRERLEA